MAYNILDYKRQKRSQPSVSWGGGDLVLTKGGGRVRGGAKIRKRLFDEVAKGRGIHPPGCVTVIRFPKFFEISLSLYSTFNISSCASLRNLLGRCYS